MRTIPSEDYAERCASARKFPECVSTLPRFLHRRAAGNMQPLTGGDDGRICMGDRWPLILMRSNFKIIFESGFQKARFWTLDDDSRAKKIFWRWCQFARFFPCRGEGGLAKSAAWVSPRPKIFLRCFQNRWFSPCRYGGAKERRSACMRIVPSEDYAGHCASAKNFRKWFPKSPNLDI